MTPFRDPAPEARAFKTLTRALIERLGGLEAAAACSRLARSRLADCQHMHTEAFLPLDVVARLEAVAGEPLITQEMARRAGCVLVPVEPVAEGEDAELMAHIGREVGEAFAAYAAGMRDGSLDGEDRARLARELGDLQRHVTAMQARLVEHAPALSVVPSAREAAR